MIRVNRANWPSHPPKKILSFFSVNYKASPFFSKEKCEGLTPLFLQKGLRRGVSVSCIYPDRMLTNSDICWSLMIVAKISIFFAKFGIFRDHLWIYLNRGKRTNSQKLFYQVKKWIRFFHLITWCLSGQKMSPWALIVYTLGWLWGVYFFFFFVKNEKQVAYN